MNSFDDCRVVVCGAAFNFFLVLNWDQKKSDFWTSKRAFLAFPKVCLLGGRLLFFILVKEAAFVLFFLILGAEPHFENLIFELEMQICSPKMELFQKAFTVSLYYVRTCLRWKLFNRKYGAVT